MTERFKLRAECQDDVAALRTALEALGARIDGWDVVALDARLPDVVCVFSCDLPLEVIRHAIATIADAQVMLDTVALEANYDSRRKYIGPAKRN